MRQLDAREQAATTLLARLEATSTHSAQSQNSLIQIKTAYKTQYPERSRKYVDGAGFASLEKILQAVSNPDLHEWDVKASQFTMCDQIAERVHPKLDHRAATFANVRKYFSADKPNIISSISMYPGRGKEVTLQVFNGGRLPVGLEQHEFLLGIRVEGRLSRWIAPTLQPTFRSRMLTNPEKDWPEATPFFYTWTPAEAWVMERLVQYCSTFAPSHLSLHADAFKINPDCYNNDCIAFKQAAGAQVKRGAGYTIRLEMKTACFVS